MPNLYGNTNGLSRQATRILERIYRRKVPLAEIATGELLKSLAEASHEARRQVGALVHRSGEVDYVVVGDAHKLMLPDIGRLRAAQGRFRALRLIHTHLHNEPLTRDDLVDLVRLRLDLVAAVQLNEAGEPRSMHYAFNVPAREGERMPYREVGPIPIGRDETDFGELISSLEAEFARKSRTRTVEGKEGRAILIHVAEKSKPDAAIDAEDRLRELGELARTAGVSVADSVLQMRERIDPRFVVGRGKLDELLLKSAELDADMLIFDRELTPSQATAIGDHTDLKIIDRTQLILDIFAQHAESSDGKLQVELAQLKYALPRLALKDDALSRLTGGIGARGPGETKLEIGRRRAKERVQFLEKQLERTSRQREQRRRLRGKSDVPVVALVGYTNAGKSTLLNALTGSDVLVEDKLFATLDTRSRRMRLPDGRDVILTDTVGFIRDLPKDLFAAFRATFEEAADADLVLQVVDASDPRAAQHSATTTDILGELGLSNLPKIVVYNKSDLAAAAHRPLSGTPAVGASRLERAELISALASALERRSEAAPIGF